MVADTLGKKNKTKTNTNTNLEQGHAYDQAHIVKQ